MTYTFTPLAFPTTARATSSNWTTSNYPPSTRAISISSDNNGDASLYLNLRTM
jgi:hypothetical protein